MNGSIYLQRKDSDVLLLVSNQVGLRDTQLERTDGDREEEVREGRVTLVPDY